MKKIISLILAVTVTSILPVSVFACSTCGCQSKAKAKKIVPVKPKVVFISKAKFQQMKKTEKDLVVIDVLSSKSFAKAHIKGAISVPLDKLSKPVVLNGLDKNKTYVVYCASTKCHASTAAAKILLKNGFKKVYDYKAGLAEWKSAKLPVKTAKLCKCGAVKGSPSCCK